MGWLRKKAKSPRPSDIHHQMLNQIGEGLRNGTMTEGEAGFLALMMGPVPGSFGDLNSYGPGRCHHLGPYPGCPGGCN